MPVTGTASLPVAPRDTPWDGPGAKRRVMEACKNAACIGRAFLWRDPGADAMTAQAYSLGYADYINGRLQIVPRGIAACAGGRGVGAASIPEADKATVKARVNSIYDAVRKTFPDWPASPFSAVTADASGTPFEGVIAMEGEATGDGRFIEPDALFWDEGPWPLVFDMHEMDHSGATVGTINSIERRDGGVIWGSGNLSASADPATQALVTRTEELFSEGAVNVSISLDSIEGPDEPNADGQDVVTKGRIRSVAVVDEGAFSSAKLSLVASVKASPDWFTDPRFGGAEDERLVWQEPERPEEKRQLGCPLTITDDGRIFGHAALWNRCHVGYPGTCVRPPKEPAAYRGFLTGERIPGCPTGPLVMRTTHASLKASPTDAQTHYDHTGYAVADVSVGPDNHGLWVAGALRPDASEADVDIIRGSALSGDWRVIGGQMRLVGLLVVNAPGFRVSRALAASGAMITTGPGCERCDDERSLEDRMAELEKLVASLMVGQEVEGDSFATAAHSHSVPPGSVTDHMRAAMPGGHGMAELPNGQQARHAAHEAAHGGDIANPAKSKAKASAA